MRELRSPCVPAELAPMGRQTRRRCVITKRWAHRLVGVHDTTADGGDVCSGDVLPDIVDEPCPDTVVWSEGEPEIGSPHNGPNASNIE